MGTEFSQTNSPQSCRMLKQRRGVELYEEYVARNKRGLSVLCGQFVLNHGPGHFCPRQSRRTCL